MKEHINLDKDLKKIEYILYFFFVFIQIFFIIFLVIIAIPNKIYL